MPRTIVKTAVITFSLFCTVFLPTSALAQGKGTEIKNILLVHGAWADGSSWSRVIPHLTEHGFNVVAVQIPLTSLQDDVNTTLRAIERVEKSNPGSILLVGHSYGGTVITEAGSNPNVEGLVYVSAFAPEKDQSSLDLDKLYPKTPVSSGMSEDEYGYITLTQQGVFDDFAQDLSTREKEILFATQGPTAAAALSAPVTSAAWQSKPSWFVIAANDRVISPALEQMEAKRMNAVTLTVPTSHVALLAAPQVVAEFIKRAAQSFGAN